MPKGALRARRQRIRQEMITELGGKCNLCGSIVGLEVDHVDPKEKRLRGACIKNVGPQMRAAELSGCQLLCKPCHIKKTIAQRQVLARGTHGTHASYKYCRCARCRAGHQAYQQEYMRRRRENGGPLTGRQYVVECCNEGA